jgi:two-component system, OmpR family, sensor histidine kinase KdpD
VTDRREPIEVALAQLERRGRDRWIVTAVVVLGVVAATGLLLFEDVGAELRPLIGGALAAVAVLYLVSTIVEERRVRRTIRALVGEREYTASLTARVRALETLQEAARGVAFAADLPEVFTRLVEGAVTLAGARSGTVLLRVGDTLTVAAGTGPDNPERGTRFAEGEGVGWAAIEYGEVVVDGHRWSGAGRVGASSVAAPLRLGDRAVGALVVERAPEAPPLTEADRAAVQLFADHAALALRDATRRARDAERIVELEDELTRRAYDASGVVHDLRSPLAAVLGYAQLIRERDESLDGERRASILGDMLDELDRAQQMLSDLLRSYAAQGGEPVGEGSVDLAQVLQHAQRTARGLAHRHGAPREVTVDAPDDLVVHGEAEAIVRVVVNLVENAIRHTPPGSPIELVALADGDRAVIQVRDHGTGVTDRVAASGGRSVGGLGLHVVRVLTEAHGGSFELRAADDGGTVAEVRLPRAVPVTPGAAGGEAASDTA